MSSFPYEKLLTVLLVFNERRVGLSRLCQSKAKSIGITVEQLMCS